MASVSLEGAASIIWCMKLSSGNGRVAAAPFSMSRMLQDRSAQTMDLDLSVEM